jgi:aspartyl-tRNA(Asn)/glutamyl-tRNA(Gln) amidotransferase subunit A
MEFAIGMPDRSKPFPTPRNPWDLETWPGGSSSGTGNGVAAGLFLAGIGTDTGGSIRIPAAFCGVSGLMPTFGRVPKSGCTPLGYSLDHIGPLARSAWDCAAMLQILAGYDPSDPDCFDVPVPDYLRALTGSLEGIRIGVERVHHFPAESDPAARSAFDTAVGVLEHLGAKLVDVSLPYFAETNAAMMITMPAEALAYHRQDMRSRWTDYAAGTRQWVAMGAIVTGADYVQAQRVRRVTQRDLRQLFTTVDAIITPTAVCGALPYADLELNGTGISKLMGRMFTSYWDAVGNPALVVPMGFTDAGLPLSLQIAGRPFEETTILQVGDAFQRATDWHARIPPLVKQAVAA